MNYVPNNYPLLIYFFFNHFFFFFQLVLAYCFIKECYNDWSAREFVTFFNLYIVLSFHIFKFIKFFIAKYLYLFFMNSILLYLFTFLRTKSFFIEFI